MEDVTPVQEQAARLRTAFDEGVVWTVQGPRDEHPAFEHAPVVPGLRPGYAFPIGDFRGRACVVVEFSLDGGPPGLRWLHRFRPPSPAGWQPDVLSDFQEGVDCWLGRSLARVPAGTSPVWTDFSWGHPTQKWTDALQLFADDDLALAAEILSDGPPDHEARALAERIAGLLTLGDAPDAAPLREGIYETFRWRIHSPQHRTHDTDRAATAAFMQEHRNPNGLWGPAWSAEAHD